MALLTETSAKLLEEMCEDRTGKSLQEFSEQDFPRDYSPELEQKRAEVSKYRLTKPSTTPWYNPQRILRHFR